MTSLRRTTGTRPWAQRQPGAGEWQGRTRFASYLRWNHLPAFCSPRSPDPHDL